MKVLCVTQRCHIKVERRVDKANSNTYCNSILQASNSCYYIKAILFIQSNVSPYLGMIRLS